MLRGKLGGRDFTAFDYSYVTGSGKSHKQHDVAVVALGMPAYLPRRSRRRTR